MAENVFDSVKLYSQERYDMKYKLLESKDIYEIKRIAKEKRADIGIAPLGKDIFRYITDKENNLFIEKEEFDNEELDALIYITKTANQSAYIILNAKQPLINQIFAAAHEYYHYIKDYPEIINKPQICSLSSLKQKKEQAASRFAAEFLLPEEALKKHVDKILITEEKKDFKELKFPNIVALSCALSIVYCIPLKAVLYRLHEENYLTDIESYLTNYQFMKDVFRRASIQSESVVKELLDSKNIYIDEIMYDLMPKAYNKGYVTKETLEEDIELLKLNKTGFNINFESSFSDDDNEDISEETRKKLICKLNI